MRVAWIFWSGAAFTAALAFQAASPLSAAEQGSVHYVAEDLGNRTKAPQAEQAAPKGLSDSAVRVMSTFALSVLPDKVPDANGEMIKLDKSDPNKYLIPIEDARRVIRVATRSAYAEVCQLLDLEKANFDAMIRTERLRAWTAEQMMFMHALHTFATSYFAGNVKITTKVEDEQGKSLAQEGAAAANANDGATSTMTPKKLDCPPGQKEKVAAAINAYVQSAPPPAAAAVPMLPSGPQAAPAPLAGGAN